MHLITGFAGTDHVTSANDGVRNAQIFGSGMHVVGIGQQLRAQIINNNTVRIYDGYGCMDGRFFEIPRNDYEEVTIDNGTQAQNRIDLICVRYEKSDTTGIETSRLVVVKGTPSASGAVAPDVIEGNILEGDLIAEFPLYEVKMNGLNLESVKGVFRVVSGGFENALEDINQLLIEEVVARRNESKRLVKTHKLGSITGVRVPENFASHASAFVPITVREDGVGVRYLYESDFRMGFENLIPVFSITKCDSEDGAKINAVVTTRYDNNKQENYYGLSLYNTSNEMLGGLVFEVNIFVAGERSEL